jgi:hypothetical protein
VYDWRELCKLSDAELAQVDVAEMNLACAAGLPEAIDYDRCVRTLDYWTALVRDRIDIDSRSTTSRIRTGSAIRNRPSG